MSEFIKKTHPYYQKNEIKMHHKSKQEWLYSCLKVDFTSKLVRRIKGEHYILIKESNQENIIVVNITCVKV